MYDSHVFSAKRVASEILIRTESSILPDSNEPTRLAEPANRSISIYMNMNMTTTCLKQLSDGNLSLGPAYEVLMYHKCASKFIVKGTCATILWNYVQVQILDWLITDIHTVCMQATKGLARLCKCADSSKPSIRSKSPMLAHFMLKCIRCSDASCQKY